MEAKAKANPYLEFDAFVVAHDGLHFEVDAHGGHECGGEVVVAVAYQK